MGSDCYQHFYAQPGIQVMRAQRVMHGTYRVLRNLTGIRVMGMSLMFPSYIFSDWKQGAVHCRLYCISALTCQWWQYSTIGGCYAEDVSKSSVAYPLTTIDSQSQTDTELAKAIVAGEYIQHYCGGDAPSVGSEAANHAYASEGTFIGATKVPLSVAAGETLGAASAVAFRWVLWAIVFTIAILCIAVTFKAGSSFRKMELQGTGQSKQRKERSVKFQRAESDRSSVAESDPVENTPPPSHRSSDHAPLLAQSSMEMGLRPPSGQERQVAYEELRPQQQRTSKFGQRPDTAWNVRDGATIKFWDKSSGKTQHNGWTPPPGSAGAVSDRPTTANDWNASFGLTRPSGLTPQISFPQPIRNTGSLSSGRAR
jgi:hypothetical protein